MQYCISDISGWGRMLECSTAYRISVVGEGCQNAVQNVGFQWLREGCQNAVLHKGYQWLGEDARMQYCIHSSISMYGWGKDARMQYCIHSWISMVEGEDARMQYCIHSWISVV